MNTCNWWDSVPAWLGAIGTCAAVIVALILAGRDARHRDVRERRRQAELVTAWLGPEIAVSTALTQNVVVQNASLQSIYMLVVSLVSVQGAFRDTAVGSTGFQATVGQAPPGRLDVAIPSGGHGMNLKLGVELAFRDAAGVCWLRHGDGRLEESIDPVVLYKLSRPISWTAG